VRRTKANRVMDQLSALGAKAILTMDIRSCRAMKPNGEAG
jgi:ATP phosphoribosyltransferase